MLHFGALAHTFLLPEYKRMAKDAYDAFQEKLAEDAWREGAELALALLDDNLNDEEPDWFTVLRVDQELRKAGATLGSTTLFAATCYELLWKDEDRGGE